jgi:hypothetical protein
MQIVHLICREKRCRAWNTSSTLVEQSKTRNERGSGTQIGLEWPAMLSPARNRGWRDLLH